MSYSLQCSRLGPLSSLAPSFLPPPFLDQRLHYSVWIVEYASGRIYLGLCNVLSVCESTKDPISISPSGEGRARGGILTLLGAHSHRDFFRSIIPCRPHPQVRPPRMPPFPGGSMRGATRGTDSSICNPIPGAPDRHNKRNSHELPSVGAPCT